MVTEGNLKANMAYLHLNKTSDNVTNAKMYVVFDAEEDDNETTAIEKIETLNGVLEQAEDDIYYNINGVRLNGKPSARGIYIKNGKKVFVK